MCWPVKAAALYNEWTKDRSSDWIVESTVVHHANKSAGSGNWSAANGVSCTNNDLQACAERKVAESINVVRGDLVDLGGGGSCFACS